MYRSSYFLLVPLTVGLLMSPLGCSPAKGSGGDNGGSSGNSSSSSSGGSSSSSSNSGGSNGGGGSSSSSSKTGGTTSNGGSSTGGNKTGGTTSNGGSSSKGGTTSNGGSSSNGGTTSNGGSSSNGGTTSNGGSSSNGGASSDGGAGGGSSSGGASGGSAGGNACAAGPNVISDFESTPGKADMNAQGTPARKGWWYVYYPGSPNAMVGGGKQTPAVNNSGPIATETSSDASSCGKYALHSTGSGFGTAPNNYVGFGAGFLPKDATGQTFNVYDASAYTGVKFKMKGGGTQQAVYFEMLTQDTVSSAQGGLLGAEGGPDVPVGLHNNRGQMLNPPWTPNAISSTYQTYTVPFGTLVPRWVPSSGASGSGTVCPASGTPKCQAPAFNPAHVLGIQVSMYQDPGFPKPAGSTAGTYDLWIDDVEFTTDDSGLQKRDGFPLTTGNGVGGCIKPQGPSADAKYLVPAYNLWKATFVSGDHVIRPENGNDTVSEGIAYGMLIAANMKDKDLFDKLWGYWKSHVTAGSLMTWCIPAGGGSCSASGGSATDADEDAAYALLQADTTLGGGYKSAALTMITDIWNSDIDGAGTKLPKGGSNYGSPSGQITNASYFAPSFYKAFGAVDSGHDWAGVITAVYKAIGGSIAGSNGLIPAWCNSSCTTVGGNGAPTDGDYQYDSHRIPMRIGMDYCYNGTAEAKAYTTKTTAFFAGLASKGMGFILDMYTPSGGPVGGTAPNSASIIGTSAVGAMASGNQTYLNDAYQEVFDAITRGTMAPVDTAGKTPYSYYNGTVGLLTALIMTGNFSH